MRIGEMLRRVLELQLFYHPRMTEEMDERNFLINHTIAPALERKLRGAPLPFPAHRLVVRGRTGTGLNAQVPLIHIADSRRSDTPNLGWYVVLLFSLHGRSVFASLNKNSTVKVDRRDKKFDVEVLSNDEISRDRRWAIQELQGQATPTSVPRIPKIDLGATSKIANAYEKTHVTGLRYRRSEIPEDEVLLADLRSLLDLLQVIYDAPPTPKRAPAVLDGWWEQGQPCRQHDFPWCSLCRPDS
jgi:hypothetical protein|tara:strand:- start:599 stop:1327 length:729 start_codon:yes stop_codon:yes gene_type:complete